MKYKNLLLLILFSISVFTVAQEIKNKKEDVNIVKTPTKIEGITTTGDKVSIKDGTTTLLEINSEGTAGSITIPSLSTIGSNTNKLYNLSGSLYWNGSALGTAGSAGGWTDDGSAVRLTTSTDKVGIGTITPSAALHVRGNDGVLFEGATIGSIPKEGTGTRMMWYPGKAAFRAGSVNGTQWDDVNIGAYSTAMGFNTIASGSYTVALGYYTTASADLSTALGGNTTATGEYSTAMGSYTTASGSYSLALGNYTKAESYSSVILGRFNLGGGTAGSWVDTDPLFEIGNGTDDTHRANALTLLKNGNVGIGPANPGEKLDIDKGNLLVRGTNSFLASGDEAILKLGDSNNYIKGVWGYGVKIGVYGIANSAVAIRSGSGNVGIGTESPSRKLFVNGDAGGTGAWNNDSDRRLKKNINTIPNALERVNKLRGVNFEWKDTKNNSKGIKMGFIAQEAEEVIPEVVDKKGEYYSMQYAPITALLVEAVKEQNAEFREQNEELKNRIEQLEKIVAEIVNKGNGTKLRANAK